MPNPKNPTTITLMDPSKPGNHTYASFQTRKPLLCILPSQDTTPMHSFKPASHVHGYFEARTERLKTNEKIETGGNVYNHTESIQIAPRENQNIMKSEIRLPP